MRPGHRTWGGHFITRFLFAGIGSAILAYMAIIASWGNCGAGLDAGGGFLVNLLGLTGLIVFPSVAAASGAVASAAHALLSRTARLEHLADTAPTLITGAGAITLIALTTLWVALGNPPDGYCEKL